jgi:threonine dehydratase
MITLGDIQQARRNIARFIHKTPLIHSNSLSRLSGAEVYLKLENLQKTGSFKVRGAINKMIPLGGEKVIAASMGNHAQAVAFAAQMLGKKAKIVMPSTVSLVKEEATRGYGADVVLFGEGFKEALEHARSWKDHVFIHAFDDDEVIAGQGTIGLEIVEDLQNIDVVFVPVGGGGLAAGTATSIKTLSPDTRVIGVQTESAPSVYSSFKGGRITEQAPGPTIADGIAVNMPGERTFEIISTFIDDMLQVSEDSIARAILLLLERKKLVVEGAGAAPLAALLRSSGLSQGKRVVLVLSGGNIDFTVVDRIIRKGLVTSGRIGVFEIMVTDHPGSLRSVAGVMAGQRANILNVFHDRLSADIPLGKTRVTFTVEVRGRKHQDEILSALRDEGYEVSEKAGRQSSES